MGDERHPGRPTMRASDADRDNATSRLSYALGEGRLDLEEYQRRLEQVMAAKTMGELEPLTEDLPLSREEQRQLDEARAAEIKRKRRRAARKEWRDFLGVALILNAIWLLTSVRGGEVSSYWPAIPLGIWAVILIASTVWPKGDSSKPSDGGAGNAR